MLKNPFKFLDSYQKEDKDRFFGREKETAQLFNAVQSSNLVMVYGGSGTGKTSLINCGLGNKFLTSDWLPIFIRQKKDINASLRSEIRQRFQDPSDFAPEQPLRHSVRKLYLEHFRPVYLIFDQFEELYIMGTKAERQEFHRTVSDLLQSGLHCKILLIIREEYLAYLAEFEKVVPSLFDNRLRIEKMSDRNLARVVAGTCRYGNIHLEDPRRVVPAILNNLRTKRDRVDLSNLQVYMDRLWRKDIERQQQAGKQVEQVVFDRPLIDSVGKMENVLSDFLDEQLAEVEEGLRRRGVQEAEGLPLEILFTLVTEDATKRNMELESISQALPKNRKLAPDDVAYCLERFEDIRLLRNFREQD